MLTLSHAAQQLRQCGCGLCRLFRREASEQSAPLTRDMRGRIAVDLKDVVIEESLPHLSLWARQVRDRNRPMKKAEERRAQGSTCTVPPIVDQHVEWRQRSNRVPPHIGNEYDIAGLKFSDLSHAVACVPGGGKSSRCCRSNCGKWTDIGNACRASAGGAESARCLESRVSPSPNVPRTWRKFIPFIASL
jgi:hypothetical protein